MEQSGEQNIGGFGNKALTKEYSRFDWYTTKVFQNEIKNVTRNYIGPRSGKNSAPYYFLISAHPTQWINFNKTKLMGEIRVEEKKPDGKWDKPLATNTKWTLINNIYHALWSKIIIKVNGLEWEDTASNFYFWKSYIQNKLNISSNYKRKAMAWNNGWVDDDLNGADKNGADVMQPTKKRPKTESSGTGIGSGQDWDVIPNPDYNSAWEKRREGLTTGNSLPFEITLYHDLMTCGRSFPPETEFEIILHRTDDKYLFITDDAEDKEYRIMIDNLELRYDLEEVTEDVKKYHDSHTTPPKTIVKKNIMKTYVVGQGMQDMSTSRLFYTQQNQLPEQLMIWFVPQTVWEGSWKSNPYNFEPLDLKEICLVVNSMNVPRKILSSVTDDKRARMELYHHFLDNIGYSEDREMGDIPISYEEYYSNSFILAFDRTVAKHNGYYQTIPDKGYIDIHLKLKDYIETEANGGKGNMVVCVYASFSEEMILDGDRFYFNPLTAEE